MELNQDIMAGLFRLVHIKGLDATPEKYLTFFLLSFIVGISILTWRYTVNPLKENESKLWRDENLLTRITLSTIVGIFSYLATAILFESTSLLSLAIHGRTF